VCEFGGGENGFAERLSDVRFERFRLLFELLLFEPLLAGGRLALEGRSDVLLRLAEFVGR
jgi:hypothetical protein